MSFVIAFSLYTIHKSESVGEFTISKKLVLLQLISNFMFALSIPLWGFVQHDTVISIILSYFTVIANLFGLAVLTYTLCTVASL